MANVMHLSMVCPRMGGSGNPGEFDFVRPTWVGILTSAAIPRVGNSTHWTYLMLDQWSPGVGILLTMKTQGWGNWHFKTWKCQISPGLPDPTILGQTIDRCIMHLSFDSPGEQYSFGISLFPAGEGSCVVLETPSLGHRDIPMQIVYFCLQLTNYCSHCQVYFSL